MQQDRISPVPPSQLSGTQKEAHEMLEQALKKAFGPNMNQVFQVHDSSGAFVGPVVTLVQYPTLAKPYMDLLGAIPGLAKISPELRETVILAVGGVYQAEYELYAHENVALKSTSLTKKQIDGLKAGRKPDGLDDKSSVAWDIANALASKKGPLEQTLWDRGMALLEQDGLMSVVNYVALYAYTCIVLNAINASVPGK